MSILRKVGIVFSISAVSLTALYYGVLFSIPYMVDLNKYKDNISSEIQKQSGFKVACEDISFKKSLSPYFKIHLYHTMILYPDDKIFIKLKDAELKIKILPLIFKKIEIKDAKLIRPIINIDFYKDFTTSVEKYLNFEQNTDAKKIKFISIANDTICERYKLKIFDETTSKTFLLEGDELKIKDFKHDEKIQLILKGVLSENEKEYISYDIDLKTFLKKFDNSFAVSPFKQILDYDVRGKVWGNIEIENADNYKGNIHLENFRANIDGNIIKDNNANLILKGDEAEITSVLHTSDKDSANVQGKFNYGKKKYIDLNVKAKNINIAKLQKIINVLSQSLNITNSYSDVKLTGFINADFSVNSDFKKLKSKGIAQIIDAEISHKEIPYKINKINSEVNFDNNKIDIKKAQAYVNSTPINLTGNISENMDVHLKAKSDNLDLRTITELFLKDVKMPISLMRGNLSFESDITGNTSKELSVDTTVSINDFSAVENTQKFPLNIKSINLMLQNTSKKSEYSGSINCIDFKTIFNAKPITAKNIDIKFNNKTINIDKNTVNIINSPLTISAAIKDYMTEPVVKVSFSGNIAANNLAELIVKYVKQPYKAVGNIKIDGSFDVNKNISKINAKLRANKDNYLSYLVIKELLNKPSVLNIDADINKENITVKDISLKEDSSQVKEPCLKIQGQVVNSKEPVFKNLRIQIPEIISASMNFFGGEEVSLNGDLTINNTLKNPDVKGGLRILKYSIKNLSAFIKNADVSFANDNIRVIAPEIDVNNSKFNAVLDIEPKLSDIIIINNANVNSLNLDLNTLFPIIEKQRNPFSDANLLVKKGSMTINNFKVLDLVARDISSDFTLKNNVIKADEISANAYNGKIAGAISYDFNHASLDVNLIGKGLDIKNSLYDLCKIEDNLGGVTDFTSSVSMKTGSYNTVLKSLNGKVTFDAKEGKMGTLGKFEYYMNAQNLLYHGLLNATLNRIVDAVKPDNTSRYKTAKGSILFQNGYLIAEDIKTCGQNMSLNIKGKYNILSNVANIDIYGRISDAIKSKLGSFADVSISDLVNGQPAKKEVNVIAVPPELLQDIQLYGNPNNVNTNTFKVNVYGDINAPSSINSFSWVIPKEDAEEKFPEFSEIPQSI